MSTAQPTIESLVQDYVSLRDQISSLEAKRKKLSERIKAGLTMIASPVFKVTIADKHWQVKITRSSSRSCNYDGLKALHPEVYEQFVATSETERLDIRAVKNGDDD